MAKKSNTKATKKTKTKSTRKINFLKPIVDLFNVGNNRLRLSIGSVLGLISVYQVLSFLSYFFSWKPDQDKIMNTGFFEFIFSGKEVEIENALGKLGAWTSHTFIYEWFGIASFIFPLVFLVLGIYLLTRIRVLPLKKMLAISTVSLVVMSLVLGFFTTNSSFPYGVNLDFNSMDG